MVLHFWRGNHTLQQVCALDIFHRLRGWGSSGLNQHTGAKGCSHESWPCVHMSQNVKTSGPSESCKQPGLARVMTIQIYVEGVAKDLSEAAKDLPKTIDCELDTTSAALPIAQGHCRNLHQKIDAAHPKPQHWWYSHMDTRQAVWKLRSNEATVKEWGLLPDNSLGLSRARMLLHSKNIE